MRYLCLRNAIRWYTWYSLNRCHSVLSSCLCSMCTCSTVQYNTVRYKALYCTALHFTMSKSKSSRGGCTSWCGGCHCHCRWQHGDQMLSSIGQLSHRQTEEIVAMAVMHAVMAWWLSIPMCMAMCTVVLWCYATEVRSDWNRLDWYRNRMRWDGV